MQANAFLGMIFFLLFNIVIVLIIVNALVTIICDAFTSVRFDPQTAILNRENEEIKQCFKDKICGFLGMKKPDEIIIRDKNGRKIRQLAPDYMTNADLFPKTVDKLTLFIDDVNIELYYIFIK